MINKPKGTYDSTPSIHYQEKQIENIIRKIADSFSFQEVRTPVIESKELFQRTNSGADIVKKEMFVIEDESNPLVLRPEMTASIARMIVENKLYADKDLLKYYYICSNFRKEKPQKGRFREFKQFGIEVIGKESVYLEFDAILLSSKVCEALNIQDYKIKVNYLPSGESKDNYLKDLKSYFESKKELLCHDCQRRYEENILRILDCKVDANNPILIDCPTFTNYLSEEETSRFQTLIKLLDNSKIPYVIDPKLVRGLDYYSGTVFEISKLSNTGSQNALAGGGFYPHLLKEIGGVDLPGFGVAFGLERLIDESPLINNLPNPSFYVVASGKDSDVVAINILNELRSNNYHTDFFPFDSSFKSQFNHSISSKSKYIIILGEDEIKAKKVSIKNSETKTQSILTLNKFIQLVQTKKIESFLEKI
jgi:histidyl-tRNA synthetase